MYEQVNVLNKMTVQSFKVPSVDTYSYRHIKLCNELEAILVHDPEAEKAAAACDVCIDVTFICQLYARHDDVFDVKLGAGACW